MGWDAFNSSCRKCSKTKQAKSTNGPKKNISEMKRQLKMLGLSIDWDQEISTCDEDYKHQQELFIDFFNNG